MPAVRKSRRSVTEQVRTELHQIRTQAVARGSDGYLAVYAAGDSAIVAVIGASSLNIGMLRTARARSSSG